MDTTTVLGISIHLSDDYLACLQQRIAEGQGTQVVTLNAEMVMQARKNPHLAQAIAQAECVVPDGAGVVLHLKLHGYKIKRQPGIELAEELIKWAEPAQKSVFLIGGKQGIAHTVAQKWHSQHPRLKILGAHHGYFLSDPHLHAQITEQLQQLQPHIILVGLGVPRQELWISAHRHLCPHSLWMGVGGSFDVWSGQKQRAPKLLRNLNLEWLYRLYQEPWRWRRMLALPHFALLTLLDLLTPEKNRKNYFAKDDRLPDPQG
ncbi:MAG: WecB/TagA/CpsF family glycosyltransferase [Pseudanabaenaceae cyanobacterium]